MENQIIFTTASYNKRIRNLKLQLLKLGYGKNLYPIDNWYDNETYESIVKFQFDNKLPISGVYDLITHKKLMKLID